MGAKRDRDGERTAQLADELHQLSRRLATAAAPMRGAECDEALRSLAAVDAAMLAALGTAADDAHRHGASGGDDDGSRSATAAAAASPDDAFGRRRAVLVDALRAGGPRARLVWHGGPMTVRWALRNRIAATWRALDVVAATTGAERPAPTASVIELALELLPYQFVLAARIPPDATVSVEVDGPRGERWVLRGPVPADWPQPTDRVTGPAVDLCRLACGRTDRDATTLVAHGAIADVWLDVVDAFAFGDPPR